jgi:hypothetical protein
MLAEHARRFGMQGAANGRRKDGNSVIAPAAAPAPCPDRMERSSRARREVRRLQQRPPKDFFGYLPHVYVASPLGLSKDMTALLITLANQLVNKWAAAAGLTLEEDISAAMEAQNPSVTFKEAGEQRKGQEAMTYVGCASCDAFQTLCQEEHCSDSSCHLSLQMLLHQRVPSFTQLRHPVAGVAVRYLVPSSNT